MKKLSLEEIKLLERALETTHVENLPQGEGNRQRLVIEDLRHKLRVANEVHIL